MKTSVEIISATECKTVNPLGKRPKYNVSTGIGVYDFLDWLTAENEREVYRIEKVFIYNLLEIGIDVICNYDPTSDILKVGSIHNSIK